MKIDIISTSEIDKIAQRIGGDSFARVEFIKAVIDIQSIINGGIDLLNPKYKKKRGKWWK